MQHQIVRAVVLWDSQPSTGPRFRDNLDFFSTSFEYVFLIIGSARVSFILGFITNGYHKNKKESERGVLQKVLLNSVVLVL